MDILIQSIGPIPQPVSYLSKELDLVTKGCPGYPRAIAAVRLLVQEDCK